jgi:hypothetical protein
MAEKDTQHDVGKKHEPRTGGESPQPPDPSAIEQGTKPEELRDKADKADRPKPS